MPATSTDLSLLADLLFPIQIGKGSPPADPNDAQYAWHLIAEGDSWFSIGGIPSSNLLNDMRLPRWTQILSIAEPGDTIKRMSDIVENPDFRKFVAKPNFSYAFHGLLLSAGGNDLIDNAAKVIVSKLPKGLSAEDPASYIDWSFLNAVLDGIRKDIGTLHALWRSPKSKSADSPIFLHTYDYATPRNAPTMFFGAKKLTGPWIFKAFAKSGLALSVTMQQRVTDLMFDALAEALLSLDQASTTGHALTGVHVVDTRNTLVRANPAEIGNSNDWLNEIHPNAGGYRKIAARLSAKVAEVLSA